ncbi:MAG: GNAT family N-acetyltransferase [Gammaproteobacteria bacterium]
MGSPIDPIFSDRSWFANAMVTPYLLWEPEHTWVAEYDGHLVGYLTGSLTETFGYVRAYMLATQVLVELIPRYVTGRYDAHPRSKRFAEFVINQGLLQIPKHPQNTAHFHFNVSASHRHQGLGGRLLSAFEETLKANGKRRYYAEVMSSATEKSERHFAALGYRIYDKVKTTIFEPEVTDLYVLCVVRDHLEGALRPSRSQTVRSAVERDIYCGAKDQLMKG